MALNILPINTLHRRLWAEMAHNFILCAVFLLAIVLIGRGVQMRQLLASLNLSVLEFLAILTYMSPVFLLIVIPLSCMLSIFLTLIRMSADRELIALKAGGVSVLQLLPSPLSFAAICALLTLLLSLFGISWGIESFRTSILYLARNKAQVTIQPGIFNQDIDGMTLFARQVDQNSGEMRQIIFEDRTQGKNQRLTIIAPIGRIETDESRREIVFNLFHGRVYRLGQEEASVVNFGNYKVRLSLDKLFAEDPLKEVRPKEMAWHELRELAANPPPDEGGRFYNKVLVELQKRWSLPMACLILGLFAVPLACSFESTRKQLGLVLALLTFLTYYSLYSAGITLGEAGRLHPVVAMWLPNVIFLVAGIAGLALTQREGGESGGMRAFFKSKRGGGA
ncbi:LPS export ABC transporter permease LptF [Desulfovibrio sp. OttesenSCG-928-C14]|nr:LPS export ABC transporter permease LptF [Desulfovibrio sp. OttesenSCG-928-C14]